MKMKIGARGIMRYRQVRSDDKNTAGAAAPGSPQLQLHWGDGEAGFAFEIIQQLTQQCTNSKY